MGPSSSSVGSSIDPPPVWPLTSSLWQHMRSCIACIVLACGAAAVPGLAFAQEPAGITAYTGRVVAQRSLEAPLGGLPEESLEPLLRVHQDGLFNPQDVRRDIAMLVQVGDFARIEVDVEDAVVFDDNGEPAPAVNVVYRVYAPMRVAKVEVEGNRHLARRAVRGVLGLDRGDAWNGGEASLERRLVSAYAADGWPAATAKVRSEPDTAGETTVIHVDVSEGEPNRLAELRVRGTDALPEGTVRWILGRRGVRVGAVVTPAELTAARDALLLRARKDGWFEARINLEPGRNDAGQPMLAVIVDPGRRWSFVRQGDDLPSEKAIVAALELERGVRIGRRWAADAARTLTEASAAEGFLAATYTVTLEDKAEEVRVTVSGEQGARHHLRDVTFVGAEGEDDRVWSARYLRGAFREAALDTISRRRITPGAVDAALAAMEEFYRAQGYLSVELTREAFEPAPGRRRVPVDVRVAVAPGPRAMLTSVRVEGAAEGVDVAAPFDDLVGKPLNPAAIDARTRRLVEAHDSAGYLSADAQPRLEVSGDGESADVVVEVRPGPVVYLRTVIIKGHRRTLRRVIQREVDLSSGDPLASSRVEAIRRRLYDLGLFDRVDLVLAGDEDRVKDLVITVEEKRNLYFEAGGGIATDNGAKLFLRAGHRNLFGLGHRLNLYGQFGLGWVGDGWTPDFTAPEWRAALRYEAAHVPTRGERLLVDVLFNERAQEQTFRLQRSGAGVGLHLRLGPDARAEVGYRVQVRQLLDVDPGALVVGDPWLNELSVRELDGATPSLPSDTRAQSGLGLSFVFDLRDDPVNPRQGAIGSVNLDLADRLLTDVSFARMETSWTWFVPAGALQLLFRGHGGLGLVAESGATLPLEDRFRLGGAASFRGFELESMGPANLVPQEELPYPDTLAPLVDYATRNSPSRWVPTGGDALAQLTAEVWFPFDKLGFPSLSGTNLALFADVGNVYFVSPTASPSSTGTAFDPTLRWSVGVGLRRATPVGPIQIDLGFNPDRIGARGETLARLHLSLGAL